MHLLHKTAKHKINQVFVFLMNLSYIRIFLINRHIGIEYCIQLDLEVSDLAKNSLYPLPSDFCSINVCRGAFQTGPCKKQTNESKTHESSADIFLRIRNTTIGAFLKFNQLLCKMSSAFIVCLVLEVVAMITSPAHTIETTTPLFKSNDSKKSVCV